MWRPLLVMWTSSDTSGPKTLTSKPQTRYILAHATLFSGKLVQSLNNILCSSIDSMNIIFTFISDTHYDFFLTGQCYVGLILIHVPSYI